ncbi:helix-turn-helix domain-containing protein [Rhodococcus sp. KBS0724]|uniref:helix-turn-helix domain-containing protein n=1 Tax=Rhodococcus sp. KBS0724 TaxID=1179674 RepID=UPI00110EC2DF|nr:helix-turn-helix domain-containing protein [Rhodococcus sp. KBS0724]
MTRPLLTSAEAGEILNVSAAVDARMCRRRELPCIMLSPRKRRIAPEDLDAFIASRRRG